LTEYLKKLFEQIQSFLSKQTPKKKLAIGLVMLGIVTAIGILFMWAGNTSYVTLMTNLGPEDSTHIIRLLREKHIPFKVDPSGKTISVPQESLYEFRLELATSGLPQTGVVGYEVFDKQSLGTTSFVQKMNQKRALEGELMRSINAIRGVKRSRVHLAIPQKSTFIEDQKKSTASVVIDLEAGTVLSEKQVLGSEI
jgi:flagellar M-ring protein FliF